MTVSSDKPGLLAPPGHEEIEKSAARGTPASCAGHETREKRRRGRPLLMPKAVVLEEIRQLARREEGIFRAHLTHGRLYARARRMFGSWAAALETAGVDYAHTLERARRRGLRSRRNRAAKRKEAQQT